MANNQNQMCVLGVYFPCPDNACAARIKDEIEKLLADIPEAAVELTLRSGVGHAVHPQRVPGPV